MTDSDGLDLQELRAIAARSRGSRSYTHLLDRIAAHLDAHDGFVSWSGGKDSTTVVDLVRQVDRTVPVVNFDSGLQYPETLAYLDDLAERWRLNFHVIPAEPSLLSILIAGGGFDHAAPDRDMAGRLADTMINIPAAAAHGRYGNGSMWGVRAEESAGRKVLYRAQLATETTGAQSMSRAEARRRFGGTVRRKDGTVTYGPIWDWQHGHVFQYLAGRGIEPNPLYEKMARLGVPQKQIRVDSIIDGAFLSGGQMAWLQKGWPTLFDQLVEVLPRLPEWT